LRYFSALLALALFCCSHEAESPDKPGGIDVVDSGSTALDGALRLEKVVVLEPSESALLGSIDAVHIDPTSGDLLVGDFRAQNRVFRFSSTGRFIRAYGQTGQGPGEYSNILDFDLLTDGSLAVLSSYALLLYAPDGSFLGKTNLLHHVEELSRVGDRLYCRISSTRDGPSGAVAIYDEGASFIGVEGEWDEKIDVFSFWPYVSLAERSDELAFFDNFSLTLNLFEPSTGTWARYALPDLTPDLSAYWEKGKLDQQDEQEIQFSLHQAVSIFGLEQGYFFREILLEREIDRYALFQPETGALFYWRNNWQGGRPTGPWSRLAGSVGNQLIAVLDEEGKREELTSFFPRLKDVTLGPDDNPILLFYALDARSDR